MTSTKDALSIVDDESLAEEVKVVFIACERYYEIRCVLGITKHRILRHRRFKVYYNLPAHAYTYNVMIYE